MWVSITLFCRWRNQRLQKLERKRRSRKQSQVNRARKKVAERSRQNKNVTLLMLAHVISVLWFKLRMLLLYWYCIFFLFFIPVLFLHCDPCTVDNAEVFFPVLGIYFLKYKFCFMDVFYYYRNVWCSFGWTTASSIHNFRLE